MSGVQVPSAIIAALTSPVTYVTRRCEIYESDGNTLWLDVSDRLVDGTVSVQNSDDTRRTIDVTLSNTDGALQEDPYGGLWYDKVVKTYRGFNLPNMDWEIQTGEFVVEKISSGYSPKSVKLTGRDYVKRCEVSKFTQTTTYSTGKSVEEVISAIGFNARCFKQRLPPTGRVLQRDFTFDRGSTRWDAMKAIATAYSLELFFDQWGFLVLRDFLDPVLSPIAFVFQVGSLGNIADYTRSTEDTQLYNHVLVTGESSDTNVPPVWGEAINTESSSPTSVQNLNQDRLYTYSSSFITTTQQAKDVALSFLKVHALEAYTLDLTTLVIPWLDAGSIVQFLDPDPIINQPTRYLLDSFSLPMKLGTMAVTGKRVTIVSDNAQTMTVNGEDIGATDESRVYYQPGSPDIEVDPAA